METTSRFLALKERQDSLLKKMRLILPRDSLRDDQYEIDSDD